jgi:ribonuclease P protein component
MRKHERLTSAKDFAAVRRSGRRWSDNRLVLWARPNRLGPSRYGFAVGRRIGNAVVRNRIKRRLREAAARSGAAGGWDLLVVARREAPSASFDQLSNSMTRLLRRAGIVGRSTEDTSGPTDSQ